MLHIHLFLNGWVITSCRILCKMVVVGIVDSVQLVNRRFIITNVNNYQNSCVFLLHCDWFVVDVINTLWYN